MPWLHLRVIWLGAAEQRLQAQQCSLEGHGRAPLILEDVEADGTVGAAHIGVPHLRGARCLRMRNCRAHQPLPCSRKFCQSGAYPSPTRLDAASPHLVLKPHLWGCKGVLLVWGRTAQGAGQVSWERLAASRWKPRLMRVITLLSGTHGPRIDAWTGCHPHPRTKCDGHIEVAASIWSIRRACSFMEDTVK